MPDNVLDERYLDYDGTPLDVQVGTGEGGWKSSSVPQDWEELQTELAYANNNQEDFISTLQRHMNYSGSFNILPNNLTDNYNVSVLYEVGNEKAISYTFFKQLGIDDFLMLGIGRYGNLVTNQNLLSQSNFDSRTGTWNDIATYYTTQVGATVTKSFYGSKITARHHRDNRGGYWRYIIDGDTAHPVDVSVWNATADDIDAVIFESTQIGTHTIVGTFMGDDPSHVPSEGAGTSRGWLNYIDGQYTFSIYVYAKTNSAIIETMIGGSNKEFAFQLRKSGTNDPYYFIPYHTAVTMYKAAEPIFLVDSVPTTLEVGKALNNVKDLKIIQSLYARVPEHSGVNLAKITCITSFSADGVVNFDGKIEAIENIDIDTGYVAMLPLNPVFSKVLISGVGNSYPTIANDGSVTILDIEADKCISYLALNDSTYNNVGVAMRINNPKQTLRQQQLFKGDTFIQHRVDNNQKLYPQIYKQATLTAGTVDRFSVSYYIAEFDGLSSLF